MDTDDDVVAPAVHRISLRACGRALFAALAVVTIATGGLDAQAAGFAAPSADTLQHLLQRATFVFRGTVLARDSTVNPTLPHSARTAVVRVLLGNSVLACPKEIGDYGGDALTVATASATSPAVGETAWFFAEGWSIARTLAVTSLREFPAPPPNVRDTSMERSFDEAVHLGAAALVRAIVAVSDAVFVGRITAVGPAPLKMHRPGEIVIPQDAEQWARADVIRDSMFIKGVMTADSLHKHFSIVLPMSAALDAYLQPLPGAIGRHLFIARNISRAPVLGADAFGSTYYLASPASLRPTSDAGYLTGTRPTGLLGLDAPGRCGLDRGR